MKPAPIKQCPTCKNEGERGSCARLRCYCGHPECWAYPSYENPYGRTPETITVRAPNKRMAQSWAEREEPTWLDR